MKKIFIDIARCELRLLDGRKISTYLSKKGYKIVDKPEDAEIIFFVTCSGLNVNAENSLNKVKNYLKYNAELIIGGCLPETDKEELSKIFNGKVISTRELHEDLEKIDNIFPDEKVKFRELEDENIVSRGLSPGLVRHEHIEEIKKFFRKSKLLENYYLKIKDHVLENLYGEHSIILDTFIIQTSEKPYHIRIAWGCMGNCTYCAIKNAIGSFHSKLIDECVREFKKGLDQGYHYFIINADDTGVYGLDIGTNIIELLDAITKIPGEYEILVRNFNPRFVVKYIDDLEKILRRNKIIIIDSHVQGASSRVLKLMNRFSDTAKIKETFLRLRKTFPNLRINTSYILGFPTETWDEFLEAVNLIKDVSFSAGFIFSFSCRPSTKAASIEPKVPEEEKFKRIKYAEKFLKKEGYRVIRISEPNQPHMIIYERK